MMMRAYEDRQIDEWKRIRSLEYTIYCALTEEGKRVSIYEYMPLAGDPSEEEVKRQLAISKKKKASKLLDRVNKVMEREKARRKT